MSEILSKLKALKEGSGSHSPSIKNLKSEIPEIDLNIDACFLSNPYATDLFFEFFDHEVVKNQTLRDMLEFYPTQNQYIAKVLGNYLGIDSKKILIGNGAEEIIERYLNAFVNKGVVLPLPSFSPYYEYLNEGVNFIPFYLEEEDNFTFDTEKFISFVKANMSNIDTIILINPNNPNGGFIDINDFERILDEFQNIDNIILDQSFIHFTGLRDNLDLDIAKLSKAYANLVIIKSMSKDFGIAGIRAGYSIMPVDKVARLLSSGMLWNSNGIAEYFFRLFVRDDFQIKYRVVRNKYNLITKQFFIYLNEIEGLKVFSGSANFFLVDTCELNNFEVFGILLAEYGILTRVCDDKIGLQPGRYLRIASRTAEENIQIVGALKSIYNG